MADQPNRAFWDAIVRGLEAEPRGAGTVRGVSGLDHPVLAIGVDDKRGRLILVSADHDARSAAMMQADVQATLNPSVSVLVARPVMIDLPSIAKVLTDYFGGANVLPDQITKLVEDEKKLEELIKPASVRMAAAFKAASPHVVSQIVQVIQQLALIDYNVAGVKKEKGHSEPAPFGLARLVDADLTERDRELGVCALPLYDLTEQQSERLQNDPKADDVAEILTALGVRQYFFPSPDQTSLALVDRGLTDPDSVARSLTRAQDLGHPLGPHEIVPVEARTMDVIDALRHEGLVVDGEIGLEVTENGKEARATIRFQPREGIVSKLINRFKIDLSLKDLFGGPGS